MPGLPHDDLYKVADFLRGLAPLIASPYSSVEKLRVDDAEFGFRTYSFAIAASNFDRTKYEALSIEARPRLKGWAKVKAWFETYKAASLGEAYGEDVTDASSSPTSDAVWAVFAYDAPTLIGLVAECLRADKHLEQLQTLVELSNQLESTLPPEKAAALANSGLKELWHAKEAPLLPPVPLSIGRQREMLALHEGVGDDLDVVWAIGTTAAEEIAELLPEYERKAALVVAGLPENTIVHGSSMIWQKREQRLWAEKLGDGAFVAPLTDSSVIGSVASNNSPVNRSLWIAFAADLPVLEQAVRTSAENLAAEAAGWRSLDDQSVSISGQDILGPVGP